MTGAPVQRDLFASRFGAVAAAAGSAVGLGNIWRFPYIAGENGGGAFLLIYLAFILLMGIPVMLSEFIIGRSTHRNAFGAFRKLAPGKHWYLVGLMGVAAAFMILSFYTVVAGWTLEYIYQSFANGFKGLNSSQLNEMFTQFSGGTWRPLLWFFVFMSFTAMVIIGGVNRGIEKYSKILMPMLVVLMIILVIRSVTLPGAKAGIDFLFRPDFSKITAKTILDALGQAFFSLSIGMGTLITYGSYIQKRENLVATAGSVALADTLIAILAGLAIFPSVFAFHIEPGSGERLVFITLPHIFQQIPGGYLFSILFFVLLGVAALTSTISILEVIVAFFAEELKISRKSATALASLSVSILGVLCVLSSSSMADVKLFGFTVFGLMDFASANILLPLGGFFIVIFLAWFIDHNLVREELEPDKKRPSLFFRLFILIIKYLAPVAIAFIFLQGIGLIKLA